jgi:two-component system chemotaxis response regulator CheY
METQPIDSDLKTAFKCLVADDSAYARKNIATIIAQMGGSVAAEAVNGQEAVELYAALHPDLVLLDITMPVLDGVETLRRIMEHDKDAKVIVVSSIGHKEMVWKAICLGARSFVTKPYSADYAAMMIKEVLENGQGGAACATNT